MFKRSLNILQQQQQQTNIHIKNCPLVVDNFVVDFIFLLFLCKKNKQAQRTLTTTKNFKIKIRKDRQTHTNCKCRK